MEIDHLEMTLILKRENLGEGTFKGKIEKHGNGLELWHSLLYPVLITIFRKSLIMLSIYLGLRN